MTTAAHRTISSGAHPTRTWRKLWLRREPHRNHQGYSTRFFRTQGIARPLASAKRPTNVRVSSDQRPPVSPAKNTNNGHSPPKSGSPSRVRSDHVDGDSGSTFSADSSGITFHCEPSSPQYTSSGTRRRRRPYRRANREGQGETLMTPETMQINLGEEAGRGGAECQACKWSTL